MKKLTIALQILVLCLSGCALFKKEVDGTKKHRTDSGFEFAFDMQGDWYWSEAQKGQYMVSQENNGEATTIAIVRHGPVWTPGGKNVSDEDILDSFKKDLMSQARGDRIQDVESAFTRKKHQEANCLFFDQKGQDKKAKATMTYEGLVCVHPKRKYRFILMGISHRSQSGQLVDRSKDLERLISSLRFI